MAELPKLSVRLSGAIHPRNAIELAKVAEANGYHAIWFPENAFGRGALPAASACAAATTTIGIGIGVFNPYNRHPTLMAMEIAALEELAPGRVRLGIGSGIAASTERLGLSTDRPLAAVRDAIAIVRAMLKGEEVDYAGELFSARRVKLEHQAPRSDMPLLMAARGEQALALAGKLADGLIISNMCPAEFTQAAVLAGERVPSAKAALLRARAIPESDFAAAAARLRAGEPAADVLDDRFVEAFAIAGTAADALAQARRYREAGASEVALSFAGQRAEPDMQYLASTARLSG